MPTRPVPEQTQHNRCEVCLTEGVEWPACERDNCPLPLLTDRVPTDTFIVVEKVRHPPLLPNDVYAKALKCLLVTMVAALTVVGLIHAVSRFFGFPGLRG